MKLQIKRKHELVYYENCAILGIDAIFYILLGGRGTGKTYSTQKYCIKKWLKDGSPFCWLRLKEPSVNKLLANNAKDLIDSDLREKYNLGEFKVKGNTVYVDDKEFCRVMALSTFYQDKGIAMNRKTKTKQLSTDDKTANKALSRELKKFRTIVLDEMNAERSEKRTFDICYALVNQLENLCRTDTDRRIFMLGNTLEEGSDILANAFNFIPEKFGIYRLHKKRAVIHYIEDTDKYKEQRKSSIAGILAPNESTFTNVIISDIDLVVKDRKYLAGKPTSIINFGNKRFLVYGDVITSEKVPQYTNLTEIAMLPYTKGLPFYKELYTMVIDRAQKRTYKFDKLYTLKQFYSEVKKLKM